MKTVTQTQSLFIHQRRQEVGSFGLWLTKKQLQMLVRNKRAFTLIELLVVIAILGLLASIAMASLNQARITARNSKRVQDLIQVRNALELYKLANGQYPVPADNPPPDSNNKGISCWDCVGNVYSYTNAQIKDPDRLEELVPYLPIRPEDPKLNLPTGV